MAEERFEGQEATGTSLWAWTELFRTFQVALDPRKLFLAAAGILVMAAGWYVIDTIFNGAWVEPKRSDAPYGAAALGKTYTDIPEDELNELKRRFPEAPVADLKNRWLQEIGDREFNRDHDRWQLMYDYAGDGEKTGRVGKMRTWPWSENRGPNPYMLVTGQTHRPWEKGQFWDWMLGTEIPVLLEPLVKFLQPVVGLLDLRGGFWNRVYFLLILLWTLATWAFFGGVITRLAAVQLAGKDRASFKEAVSFVRARFFSYFSAPLVPLGLVALVVVGCVLYGFLFLIPVLGDVVVAGIFWPLMFVAGLIMAMLLVGLVGYPLMYTTVSTEGSDTFDALSRTYNYVYQSPWSYIWYSLVAVFYGAVLVFFIGFMGSLIVYLGKWGLNQTPLTETLDRNPDFLMIYAPTSYEWRDLLIKGGPLDPSNPEAAQSYQSRYLGYNTLAARMVGFWLTLFLLLIIGFGYSYFWTAGTMIYLLMRQKVDDTDLDEVYLEEDEEEPFPPPPSPAAKTAELQSAPAVTMVEPPTLRAAPPKPTESPPPTLKATEPPVPPAPLSEVPPTAPPDIPASPPKHSDADADGPAKI